MTEMVLQSQLDEIDLLPALPDAWKEGHVSGLRSRGDFEVDINWKNHRLESSTIRSLAGGTCRIRAGVPFRIVRPTGLTATANKTEHGYVMTIMTKKGGTYKLESLKVVPE